MKNICIIKENIDVSQIVSFIKQNEKDWEELPKLVENKEINYTKTKISGLPLSCGPYRNENDRLSLEEFLDLSHNMFKENVIYRKTKFYNKYILIINSIKEHFPLLDKVHARINISKLKVGEKVNPHIDVGDYYVDKYRFHLSLFGKYTYRVGSEFLNVIPGTLFCFNNNIEHDAVNTSDTEERITVIFDIPKIAVPKNILTKIQF